MLALPFYIFATVSCETEVTVLKTIKTASLYILLKTANKRYQLILRIQHILH